MDNNEPAMVSKNKPLAAHLSMFLACAIWGLMAPIGKDAMSGSLDGIDMVSFRVAGAALLFWIASLFTPKEKVSLHDRLLFAVAAIFGLILNQCCFIIGLSYTSPSNASIETTSSPIFAMILAFIILKEPLTWKKVSGVFIGCAGALMLILASASAGDSKVGDIRGDLMVLGAQLSYAFFLSRFNPLVRKYSVVTVNKWMFLWGTLLIWPFSGWHVYHSDWAAITAVNWLEVGYVVVFGTFIGYLLIINAQKILRPTVVAIYNYVQPVVAVSVSLYMGISIFKWSQGLAVILVFTGVWMVTKSKSKRDLNNS
jgi:drug/metabolite transporter (DMT)-like permease